MSLSNARKVYDFQSENSTSAREHSESQRLLQNFETKTAGSIWPDKLEFANAKRHFISCYNHVISFYIMLACYNAAFYFHIDRRLYSIVYRLDKS